MQKNMKKASLIFVVLVVISILFLFSACIKPSRTEEIELSKNNINIRPAWESVISGLNKTAIANSCDVAFSSYKEAVYGDFSSKENLAHTIKISGLNAGNFTATATKNNIDASTKSEYFFTADKFYFTETSANNQDTSYLFVSDNIDVLKEITGLNVFGVDVDAVKKAIKDSKSIQKSTKEGLSQVRFELSAEELTSIMGDVFEVVPGMDEFSGFMYLVTDKDGFLVKLGYDSHYSAVFDGEQSYVKRNVEYKFSNINKIDTVEKPEWVDRLTPEKIDTVKCIKNKTEFIFLYEEIDGSDEKAYKLYDIINAEDNGAKIRFAEVPAQINDIPVYAISGTAVAFGKGVEVLVLPEHITEVPYPEISTPMTVFCKCKELSVPAISGTTVYLAGQWDYVGGVPTVNSAR